MTREVRYGGGELERDLRLGGLSGRANMYRV